MHATVLGSGNMMYMQTALKLTSLELDQLSI